MSDPTPEDVSALFARLTDRGLTIPEIGSLTDAQIVAVYAHPRDEKGDVEQTLSGPVSEIKMTERERDYFALFGVGRSAGVPEVVLLAEWSKKYTGEPSPHEA